MLPQYFFFSGVNCGIKKESPDLGIIFSQLPANWAGMFTINKFPAAPVLVSKEKLGSKIKALVVNSGIANAGTGEEGIENARRTCKTLAKHLEIRENEVLVASTGVIGKHLPMELIEKGIIEAIKKLSPTGYQDFAKAIMTTDKYPKIVAKEVKTPKGSINILGIAKGAGMIHPNLATMLVFLLTDALASSQFLQECLKQAVDDSFHCLTIDGDTSTNDSVFLIANGASGVEADNTFGEALRDVCIALARMIAEDGEGATKLVVIRVNGAEKDEIAREIGRRIAISPLVKTAIFGGDPNVGRILCALGNAPFSLEPQRVEIKIAGFTVAEKGNILTFPYDKLKKALKEKEINIEIELNMGDGSATIYTCDLSYDYVKLNAEYTT
ncbi:bifunctional glutamate N-acetyltransferase/amino-acid acetyltransferase ArgJ [bacterium]|nr:bifunctional glutamate N-acetyltransferase/amino-acid acetyltransferase ArgJ [bacterium]